MGRPSSVEQGSGWAEPSTSGNPNSTNRASCSSPDTTHRDDGEEDNEVLIRGHRERPRLWWEERRSGQNMVISSNTTCNNGKDKCKEGAGCGRVHVVGNISLREWLDEVDRPVDLVQCLHIFRQIVEMVSAAHEQGVVVHNIRPSCFVMSSFNRVAFIESTSCSTSGSGSDSSCGSDGHGGRCESPTKGDHLASAFEPASVLSPVEEEGSEQKKKNLSFPLKRILGMEFNWYTSPEEAARNPVSLASDVYRLGVLLFELLCPFSSVKDKFTTMSNLRHRVLPPQLLHKCPKGSFFCLRLLHPQPSTRPNISEVLKSDFLSEPREDLNEHDAAIKLRKDIEEQELLLGFLLLLQKRKIESAHLLQNMVCCLSSDIEEVLKKQSILKKVLLCPDLDKDEISAAGREDQTSVCPEVIDDSEISSSRKRHRQGGVDCSEVEDGVHFAEELDADSENTGSSMSKSFRLMKNFKKMESAYFLTRFRMNKPTSKGQIETQSLGTAHRAFFSGMKTELSSADNLAHRGRQSSSKKSEWMNPLLDGLCRYLSFSKFNVLGHLKQEDLLNSSNLVCSLGFDQDNKLLATAGVNQKVKIFECDTILNEDCDIHYPLVEMGGRSQFSNICWNSYFKSQIASSDFEGVVQVWDVTRRQVFAEMREHEKRVWSVDFAFADPTKLASGSDDGTVKLWNINQVGSIGTIKVKANICSVQFSPDSGCMLAIGSADHRIYCYDIRTLRIPWCTLFGHSKTVSYVKFVDSSTLVSASTDNSLKLWDLSMSKSRVLGDPLQTFTGHKNMKNFVGLSISDGYIATGSETNEVFVYHKAFPMPALSFKFSSSSYDSITGTTPDDSPQFISSVCWRGQTSTLVAANSLGNIKLLEMV